jgi:GNAT superfamily N-acetyltransferase
MYEIRNLENVSFDELIGAWNQAFSDYIVPMSTTAERLETYFRVAGVDYSLSFGTFYEGVLIGMLVNAVGTFKGREVAYDAMTGITKDHRGKGLFSELFKDAKASLISRGIKQYYLEVITANENACSIYQKNGGVICRELSFLTGKMKKTFDGNVEVEVLPLSALTNKELSTYEPSFVNQTSALRRNPNGYLIARAKQGCGDAAAIFSNHGAIPQIKYSNSDDAMSLYAILACLSQKFDIIQISNVPTSETALIEELLGVGFEISVNQYEMCIELK